MHRILVSVLALSLAGGECFAQGVTVGGPNAASVAAPTSAEARKAEAKKADAKKTADEKKIGTTTNDKPTTSKISFVSRPSGVKISLSNGRSCTTPCSFIVGYNQSFTGTATKAGYISKDLNVSPDVTDQGKAYMVGMAIGAGLIGLAVAGATAQRAYGAAPIVVELVPSGGGAIPPAAAAAPAKVQKASIKQQ